MSLRVDMRGIGGPVLALILCAAPLLDAAAQEKSRANPRAAMLGYLESANAGDYERAGKFLDLSAVAPEDRARLARQLKTVLDQQLWVDLEQLSDDPAGDVGDGRARRDLVGIVSGEKGEVEITLHRDTRGEWRIAASTVARIPALYDEFGLGPLGEFLPPVMFVRIGYLELWQWGMLPLLVVLAYLIASLLTAIGVRLVLRLARRTKTDVDDQLIRAATGPVTVTVLMGVFVLATLPLGLAVPAQHFIYGTTQALAIVTVTWLAVRLIDVAAHFLEQRLATRGDTTALTVIPVGRRVAKVFLLVIAVLTGLQNMGYNVISIVAGLGVVGIAVAFAAQKTFENFFGALSLLVDRPVQRGDFCRFGDHIGTVEDIGLRSTRVRTLDRTIVTVPNAEFSSLQLENFGARDQILFRTTLGLRYETTADQLRHVLVELKRLLISHARVTPDPRRIRFVGFGAFSLDLEVYAYVNTRDWNEFLAIREELMLQIMDVVDASGTGFAFPSQTLYLGQDGGLDAAKAQAAIEQVRDWRERRELCLPDFPAERVREIEGSMPWPPEGAARG